MIGEGKVVVHAEVSIDRCPKVIGRKWPFHGFLALGVGGANYLTGAHAAAPPIWRKLRRGIGPGHKPLFALLDMKTYILDAINEGSS